MFPFQKILNKREEKKMEMKKMVLKAMAVATVSMALLGGTAGASPRFLDEDSNASSSYTRNIESTNGRVSRISRIESASSAPKDEETIATLPRERRIESINGGDEEIIGTIDVVQQQQVIMVDRVGGVIKMLKPNGLSDYETILKEKATDGAILIFEGNRAKASFEKASRQIQEQVQRKKQGHFKVLTQVPVTALDANEIAVVSQYIAVPTGVNVLEVTDQYHDSRVQDPRSDLEKGISMVNDAISTWESIKNITDRNW